VWSCGGGGDAEPAPDARPDGSIAIDAPPPTITATWTFRNVDRSIQPCPQPVAVLISQPIDANGNEQGQPVFDQFACEAGTGTSRALAPGRYRETIEVGAVAGSFVAQSLPVELDVADRAFAVDMFVDGGYFRVGWVLASTTCRTAGVANVMIVTAADAAAPTFDQLDCRAPLSGPNADSNGGTGLTSVLARGTYTITLFALDADDHTVGSATQANVVQPFGENTVTDVGQLALPLD
jgi:hypothetical protein